MKLSDSRFPRRSPTMRIPLLFSHLRYLRRARCHRLCSCSRVVIGFLIAIAIGGCAHQPKSSDPSNTAEIPTEILDLDPMLFRADPGSGKVVETLDAKAVFERAYEAYKARNYEEAVKHYDVLIQYFEDTRLFLPSLYNAGLAYEKLDRWEKAAQRYQTIIERFPKHTDTKDAYFRFAHALEQLEEHHRIVDLMTEALLRDDIQHFDRIEAHARRSQALLEIGQYIQAVDGFETLLQLNRRAAPDTQLDADAAFIVQAYFGIGRAYHHRVSNITLVLPPEKMGQDLQRKAELFLKAQGNYIRAIRAHHPQWSVAAGYMVGKLYEDFYMDIFGAEVPSDLNADELGVYFEELRAQIRPLMQRAIQVYEKNLSFSQRLGSEAIESSWSVETEQNLKRMKAFLNDPAVQKRAERLVLQGRPLQLLWDISTTAQDAVDEALDRAKQELRKDTPRI